MVDLVGSIFWWHVPRDAKVVFDLQMASKEIDAKSPVSSTGLSDSSARLLLPPEGKRVTCALRGFLLCEFEI